MNLTQEEIKEIPEELQELIVDKIGGLVFQRVIDRCAELLPTNRQKILLEMLERDDIAFHTVIGFLEESLPNFVQIAQEEGSIVAKQIKE